MGDRAKNLVVAMTGATGAIYAYRLLQVLHHQKNKPKTIEQQDATPPIRVTLVVSKAGLISFLFETGLTRKHLTDLVDVTYKIDDITAPIASGSTLVDAMVIVPCSMKTLAATAIGLSDNLISRAADVMLKERRKLVLVVRETPLNAAHLKNMLAVTEMGGIIFPPVPSFYQHPKTIEELVDLTVGRILAQLGIAQELAAQFAPEWTGLTAAQT